MIKKLIKKQIRKTGMFRELKRDKKNLQNRINNLNKEKKQLLNQLNDLNEINQELNHQINTLKSDNKNLHLELKEKAAYVGFSLQDNLRGLSCDEGKIPVLKYIIENVNKYETILDAGFGAGAYGKLLKALYYQNIDGLDVYDKHINEMGLNLIYDSIFIENITDFDFEYYDLIILGDIIEHLDLESAKQLLLKFINENKCSQMIISVPYEYEQDELYGNSHEKHLQPEINEKYMEKHYPFLNLISKVKSSDSGHFIATYYWKND